MGYWGWRPLICSVCISVWVVSCTITQPVTLSITPTLYPPITLTVRNLAAIPPPTATSTVSVTTLPPTAAPQPTDTPWVYVVQSGDTLLDIALRFNVDLAGLQAANGGLDPRALQVGQSIIIPSAAAPSQLPTPTPVALALTPPTCYGTLSGTLCLGRIDTPYDQTLQNVLVQVQLVNSGGAVLETQSTVLDQRQLPPGEVAPYRVQFATAWNPNIRVTVVLLSATPLPESEAWSIPLTLEGETGDFANGRYLITATLHNPTANTAFSIRIVATVFDAARRVIGYRVIALPTSLSAGERLPLRVVVTPQPGTLPTSYHVYVEAQKSR